MPAAQLPVREAGLSAGVAGGPREPQEGWAEPPRAPTGVQVQRVLRAAHGRVPCGPQVLTALQRDSRDVEKGSPSLRH